MYGFKVNKFTVGLVWHTSDTSQIARIAIKTTRSKNISAPRFQQVGTILNGFEDYRCDDAFVSSPVSLSSNSRPAVKVGVFRCTVWIRGYLVKTKLRYD